MTSSAVRRRSGLNLFRSAAIAIAVVTLAYAGYALWRDRGAVPEDATLPVIEVPDRPGAVSWPDIVTRLDRSIAARIARVEANPNDWGVLENLAVAYSDRARMTGDYDDYRRADALFARASAAARPGTGPHVSRGLLHFDMHRLDHAEAALAATENYAVPLRGLALAEVLGLRGDIAFYRGEYARALDLYGRAEAEAYSLGNAYRLFTYHAATGNDAEAARYFRQIADVPVGGQDGSARARIRATYHLRRGEHDLAAQSLRRADRLFPGDWRTEIMLAQMAALDGDLTGAAETLERIANGRQSPEAMDALAAIHRFRGDARLSRQWAQRAAAIWDERLQVFPEATYAHALDHELAFGTPERALELARANWNARPYGDAGIGLAWALIANGDREEARRVVEAVLASPWDSAELHAAAARVYALSGESDLAARHRTEAERINRHVFDERASLVWFGH